MKKFFKERNKVLFIITLIESILSIWFLCYFNYMDRLSYSESIVTNSSDLALLLENMYTSTWWALIILSLVLICTFSLISFIYKDNKFQLISIILWTILFILSINIKDSLMNNLSLAFIFIPIIGANIYAFIKQKKLSK